jgi:GntR family transcriptional regulator
MTQPGQGRTPLSRRIADELRTAILDGSLGPGAVLPSERELIARFNTTKATAAKVVSLLQAEGLVTTELGRGTFVRSQPPLRRISAARRHAAHRSAGKPIFDVEAISQGQTPTRRMLFVGRAKASATAAKWLQIAPGEDVVVRKRLQILDGQPAVLSTSYYPMHIAQGTRLESPDALPEGPDELIEALGHRFHNGIEVFRARMPTNEEQGLLRLRLGVPVIEGWDADFDEEGGTLQVANDIYAADRHEFAYEWNEEDIPS